MYVFVGVSGQPGMPTRPPLLQAGVRPVGNQTSYMDSVDKHSDAVARLLASGVVTDHHRLPNIPSQFAKTVDEIECNPAPPAAN